ncbi:hypothetical protein HN51_062296 [Arachis hypogaea]
MQFPNSFSCREVNRTLFSKTYFKKVLVVLLVRYLTKRVSDNMTNICAYDQLGSVLTKKAIYTVHFAAKGKCQTSLGVPNILQGSLQQVQNQNQHLLGSLNMKSDMNPMVRPQAVISDGSFVGGYGTGLFSNCIFHYSHAYITS